MQVISRRNDWSRRLDKNRKKKTLHTVARLYKNRCRLAESDWKSCCIEYPRRVLETLAPSERDSEAINAHCSKGAVYTSTRLLSNTERTAPLLSYAAKNEEHLNPTPDDEQSDSTTRKSVSKTGQGVISATLQIYEALHTIWYSCCTWSGPLEQERNFSGVPTMIGARFVLFRFRTRMILMLFRFSRRNIL